MKLGLEFLSKGEKYALCLLFILLQVFLFLKAYFVFPIHDEISTLLNYMVPKHWEPYRGELDANNHFLNSFLGSISIGLFGHNNNWALRLPNVLSFALYFWSIAGIAGQTKSRVKFWSILSSLTLSVFLLDFFCMARGYGLSLAFMFGGIFFATSNAIQNEHLKGMAVYLLWAAAIYANLNLIPVGIVSLTIFTFYHFKKAKVVTVVGSVLAAIFFNFLLNFGFHLKEHGKLYYGAEQDFVANTLHSLTLPSWNLISVYLDLVLLLLTVLIIWKTITTVIRFKELKINGLLLSSVLFLFCLGSVFLFNWILDVKFPRDRTALHFLVLFLVASISALPNIKLLYIIPLIHLGLFLSEMNISFIEMFKYEHFDKALLTKIPEYGGGTMSTVGAWGHNMDNERVRREEVPFFGLQRAETNADTLCDFIVLANHWRPDIGNLYEKIYEDPYSQIVLRKRKQMGIKTLRSTEEINLDNNSEYYIGLSADSVGQHTVFEIEGEIEQWDPAKNVDISFRSENMQKDHKLYIDHIRINTTAPIKNGKHVFHFSVVVPYDAAHPYHEIILWNHKRAALSGKVEVKSYQLTFE